MSAVMAADTLTKADVQLATGTKGVWQADMAKMDAKLHKAGAVKTLPDGFQYIEESVLPVNPHGASLATAYWGLVQFGFANGYLQ